MGWFCFEDSSWDTVALVRQGLETLGPVISQSLLNTEIVIPGYREQLPTISKAPPDTQNQDMTPRRGTRSKLEVLSKILVL